ncbi:hypothetical protein [Streptosporangium carneum]|nr:hypothetical protein [Streptosporangium carneum]
MRTLDGWIFGEADSFAWVQEWQIGRDRLLRRSYRDTRFAALMECGLCHGEGTARCAVSGEAGRAAAAGGEAGRRRALAEAGRGTGADLEKDVKEEMEKGMEKGCSLCDGTGRLDRLWLRERR